MYCNESFPSAQENCDSRLKSTLDEITYLTKMNPSDPKPEEESTNGTSRKLSFSIEHLVKLSESPFCLETPNDWEQISQRLPAIVKSKVEPFQGEKYLEKRNGKTTAFPEFIEITRSDKSQPSN